MKHGGPRCIVSDRTIGRQKYEEVHRRLRCCTRALCLLRLSIQFCDATAINKIWAGRFSMADVIIVTLLGTSLFDVGVETLPIMIQTQCAHW